MRTDQSTCPHRAALEPEGKVQLGVAAATKGQTVTAQLAQRLRVDPQHQCMQV